MTKLNAILCIAVAGLALACSSDSDKENQKSSSEMSSGGPAGSAGLATSGPGSNAGGSNSKSGSPSANVVKDFDSCFADVKDSCSAHDMNTPELMETPCKALTMLPIPLTDGSQYGPVTLKTGPYGGKAEWNEGAGTEFVNPVNAAEPVCVPTGIETFMEPAAVNAEIENLRGVDYGLYTIFRPACFKPGEKYPVITWANGTCGEIAGYAPLLSTLAGYGYVIIASNSTWTATTPTNKVQLRALDYAKALNEDPSSIFHQRLDLDKVGAMGHSQGASATKNAEADPRIKALLFWNSGNSAAKPFLTVSGERDVGGASTPATMASGVNASMLPGAWVYYHKVLQTGGNATGHLVLMEQPDRVIDMAIAWWKWQLNGDEQAKKMFVGDDCGLCNKASDFEYGHNSLLQ